MAGAVVRVRGPDPTRRPPRPRVLSSPAHVITRARASGRVRQDDATRRRPSRSAAPTRPAPMPGASAHPDGPARPPAHARPTTGRPSRPRPPDQADAPAPQVHAHSGPRPPLPARERPAPRTRECSCAHPTTGAPRVSGGLPPPPAPPRQGRAPGPPLRPAPGARPWTPAAPRALAALRARCAQVGKGPAREQARRAGTRALSSSPESVAGEGGSGGGDRGQIKQLHGGQDRSVGRAEEQGHRHLGA